jgi:membrane protein implicated in regulation of membrane protease activity
MSRQTGDARRRIVSYGIKGLHLQKEQDLMPWWLWLTVGLGLFLGDLLIPGGLVLCFFGAGALAVGLLVALMPMQTAWVEWLLFSGFSIVALLLFRPSLVCYVRRSDASLSLDSLVGESAVTLEAIAVDGLGGAELRGTTWTVGMSGPRPCTTHNAARSPMSRG